MTKLQEEKIMNNKDISLTPIENVSSENETEITHIDLDYCSNGKIKNNTIDDASEIETDINELIPTPPDGGWGWVIVLSSFINHFILDGISYAFGSFMKDYKEYFNSSAAMTSALMSCLVGCYMLSAPVASALINKYGCRPVGIAGSLIASFAFVICTFSPSIQVMIFSFGVLGGIGFGLMYMPAVISVSLYFEKKRSIAVGIGMCGTGVGTCTFGVLGKLLLDIMDWKSAHFILAGIILNGAVFAALIRPLETKHDLDKRRAARRAKQSSTSVAIHSPRLPSEVIPDTPKSGAGRTTASQIIVRSPGQGGYANSSTVHVYRSMNRLGSQKITTKLMPDEAEDLKRPLYRKDIFYSGSIYHLPEYKQSQQNVREFVASVTSIPVMQQRPDEKTFKCKCLPRQIGDALSEMLDLSLLKDPTFLILAVLALIVMLAYLVPFAFISARAVQLGVEPTRASFLIFMLGISTTIGRLLSSAVAQVPRLKALYVHNIFLALAGVACGAVPLCHSFELMATAAFAYGFFIGGHVALSPIILVDLLGLDKLNTAYGLLILVRGISTVSGPPLAGWMFDQFNTFDVSFYISGALIIVSSIGFCTLEMKCFSNKTKESTDCSST